MSDKISLAFCVHSHQPVGNYESVFSQGARDCYLPFLRVLKNYPDIGATLHYTGPLLEWFQEHDEEFFALLKQMLEHSQIELMSGGFYEPIIPVIPEDDAKSQIMLMSQSLQAAFGVLPRGMWCAERIWDPCIPKKIAGLGMEYTLLDDSHFLAAGLPPEEIHGYYITEREGCPIRVFPIDMHLRYLIPFKEPMETVEYLLSLRDRGVRLITYGDDGEKFGMWPGTHTWVYKEKWLERFFDAVSQASDEIELIPLVKALDQCRPKGLVYLPTATYQEMMEWSLFWEQGRYYEDLVKKAKQTEEWPRMRAFLRGGMWDNFLAKYPESNRMHKKMLQVSSLVKKYATNPSAAKYLYKAQCNCAYWHGLFGGIYITKLRDAVYENLLKAEECLDESRFKNRSWSLEWYDFDLDGAQEAILSGKRLNCTVSPHIGASLCMLEYKPLHYQLSNILMRHQEIYHRTILEGGAATNNQETSAEPRSIHDLPHEISNELKDALIYDTYPRFSFMTHFLKSEPDMNRILSENRIDCSSSSVIPFDLAECTESENGVNLVFQAHTEAGTIIKRYAYDPEGVIAVSHEIVSESEQSWLALEWNIMILSGQRPFVEGAELRMDRGCFRAKEVVLKDEAKGLQVVLGSPSAWDILIAPLECVSQNEDGFEKTFQGWSIYFVRPSGEGIPDAIMRVGETCQS
ncbi:MAG: DUF1926 domain-containing protein [Deltaproteobacteria bacterium]|nr:DUF1926 domain-containing protein [Deltaproteobacteria bacterium]